ncbi:putative DEAD/DEAH box helicase domain-containing protein [Neospora caninum Liverpool]|uniref:Putative DEAD/DEAH box helicase domain-containing protein n=1 Tax=Neospora caninum (strain Liverpool) TaxID=572307 RepID=F0VCI8_NEOCL|nr:putative DEAD/DEAH box helicase domain-containing protein [Neospora caninum Liverpool]CBZ51677.1 putative DEAD/DEAH box helicase domain-containing protein [Neospora caninum Liverpool]|eukprot:XP_003881710.1 putative DEAD/DEAH box helicase domain-containing protein [Neospora caninum Liverpool]
MTSLSNRLYGNDSDFWTSDDELDETEDLPPVPSPRSSSFACVAGAQPEGTAPDKGDFAFPLLSSPLAFASVPAKRLEAEWRPEDDEFLKRTFGFLDAEDACPAPAEGCELNSATASLCGRLSSSPGPRAQSGVAGEGEDEVKSLVGLRFIPSRSPAERLPEKVAASWEGEAEEGGLPLETGESANAHQPQTHADAEALSPRLLSPPFPAEGDADKAVGPNFFFFPPLDSLASSLLFGGTAAADQQSRDAPLAPLVEILPPRLAQSSPRLEGNDDEARLAATAAAVTASLSLSTTSRGSPVQSPKAAGRGLLSPLSAHAGAELGNRPGAEAGDGEKVSFPLEEEARKALHPQDGASATPVGKDPVKRQFIRKRWCVEDNSSDVSLFRRRVQAARRERARMAASAGNVETPEREACGDAGGVGALAEGEETDAVDPEVLLDGLDDATRAWLAAIPQEPGDLSPLQVPLALEFPFPLDDFQKRAILHLEKYQTVFVAAHTSAGKTVVAEYAIALAVRRNRRCIYTSPLKALSNQKYREFRLKFPSVGIVTGDVCINPDANCLIVTTEILRSLLYLGDALIGQVDSVIFDEAHYINDIERGVVWEEAIILLPKEVNMILLSATLPNYRQFADWIGAVKQREVFTLSTDRRPTPLRHFLFFHDKAFLLMDAKGRFQAGAYNEAFKHVRDKGNPPAARKPPLNNAPQRGRGGARGGARATSVQDGAHQSSKGVYQTAEAKLKTEIHRLQGMIAKLEKDNELPVVVFCFSRRKCETYAQAMRKLNVVLSHNDRSKIHLFVKDCLMALSPADRELPQIRFVCSLVQRGVGIHHGGLLPIIKEMVEILFQRGLVRVLFATETLAIGLNMPARSVVFSALKKHDGQRSRMLLASEYTQMAGRAGRRGIDTFGHVYIFCSDDIPDPKALRELPEVRCVSGEPEIEELADWEDRNRGIAEEMHMKVWQHKAAAASVFSFGRVCFVHSLWSGLKTSCPAIFLNVDFRPLVPSSPPTFRMLVLLPPWVNAASLEEASRGLGRRGDSVEMICEEVVKCPVGVSKNVTNLTFGPEDSQLLGMLAQDLERLASGQKSGECAQGAAGNAPGTALTPLSFSKPLKQLEVGFVSTLLLQKDLFSKIRQNKCFACPLRETHMQLTSRKRELMDEIAEISSQLHEESLDLYPEMQARLTVLKKLKLIDEDSGTLTVKGRVACQVMSGDELTLTEFIFQGGLENLEPEEIAAVLSAFVAPDGPVEQVPAPTAGIQRARDQAEEIHVAILKLQANSGVRVNAEDWWKLCNFSLSLVAYDWANGVSFGDIMQKTNAQEGSIVRAILRLDELLRKIRQAAVLIGDPDLGAKLQLTSDRIRRDIVFAMSLYLQ